MKKKGLLLAVGILTLTVWVHAGQVSQGIVDLANTKLAAIGSDPVIVQAVMAQNARGMTLDEIKAADAAWMATPGIDEFMKTILENDCALRINEIAQASPFFGEIFVMDNQGANVAMTQKTTDYWQGDEAKFIKSFKGGQGEVFIDEVKFDDSTQAYLVQVSVPVKDGERVIGAVTFGIDVDQFK